MVVPSGVAPSLPPRGSSMMAIIVPTLLVACGVPPVPESAGVVVDVPASDQAGLHDGPDYREAPAPESVSPEFAGEGPPPFLEIRVSDIPTAGKGLFATADLPAGSYIGDYTGVYLTDAESDELGYPELAYLFQLPDCAQSPYDDISVDLEH